MFGWIVEKARAKKQSREEALALACEADQEKIAAGDDDTIDEDELNDRLDATGMTHDELLVNASERAERKRLEGIIAGKAEAKARKEATGTKKAEFIQGRNARRREFEAKLQAEFNVLVAENDEAVSDLAEIEATEEKLFILRRTPPFGPMTEERRRELAEANVMTGRLIHVQTNGNVEMWDEDGRIRVLSPNQVQVSPRDLVPEAKLRYDLMQTDDGLKPRIIGVVKPQVPAMAG